MTGHWLADPGYQPEVPGAMRFFVQPQAAAGTFSDVGVLRRRDLEGYSEFEYEFAIDGGGSMVGVLYWLPEFGLVATSFGTSLQPVRRLLFGPMTDRGREQIIAEFDESRPMFMAGIRNGLQLNFKLGGFYTFDDKADASRKVLLAFKLSEAESAEFRAGRHVEACQQILAASLQVWVEVQQPINSAIFAQTGPEWNEIGRNVASSAKWLVENAENIKVILKFVGIG